MTISSSFLSISNGAAASSGSPLDPAKVEELKKSAQDFETAFLAETLSHIGLDATGGVAGATEFSSILNRAYAEHMVERGGLGIAADVFQSLADRERDA
jgi:hypothetical protein